MMVASISIPITRLSGAEKEATSITNRCPGSFIRETTRSSDAGNWMFESSLTSSHGLITAQLPSSHLRTGRAQVWYLPLGTRWTFFTIRGYGDGKRGGEGESVD